MCSLLSKLYDATLDKNLKWPSKIKSILDQTELTYMPCDPFLNVKRSQLLIKQICYHNFLFRWKENVAINSQREIYRLFKKCHSAPRASNLQTDASAAEVRLKIHGNLKNTKQIWILGSWRYLIGWISRFRVDL